MATLFGDSASAGASHGRPAVTSNQQPLYVGMAGSKRAVTQRALGPRPLLHSSLGDGRVPIPQTSSTFNHRPIYPAMAPVRSGIYPFPTPATPWNYMNPGGRGPMDLAAQARAQALVSGGETVTRSGGQVALQRAEAQGRRQVAPASALSAHPLVHRGAELRHDGGLPNRPLAESSGSFMEKPVGSNGSVFVGAHGGAGTPATGSRLTDSLPAATIDEFDRVLGAIEQCSADEEMVMLAGALPACNGAHASETMAVKRGRPSKAAATQKKVGTGFGLASSCPPSKDSVGHVDSAPVQDISMDSFDALTDTTFALDSGSVDDSYLQYFD